MALGRGTKPIGLRMRGKRFPRSLDASASLVRRESHRCSAIRLAVFLLKLPLRLADNSFVQRSAIVGGVVLALGAVTLAGIAEWASGGFGSSGVGDSDFTVAGNYSGAAAALRNSLPSAPVGSLTTPGYTIQRTVPEVRLQFTVADQSGRPVQGLSARDIRILDDQSQVEQFQDFSRDENLPLRLGVLIDASDSVKKELAEEKTTAVTFLQQVLRPQTDHAFFMAFGTKAAVWEGAADVLPPALARVERLTEPSWGTNLYDALFTACADHLWRHHESETLHLMPSCLSATGRTTQSHRALADVIAMAERSETQIYTLTLRPKGRPGRGEGVMRRLADETGGRFFVASSSKELQGAFSDIEQEMRTQYFVSFRPSRPDPGFHALQVEVRAPEKLQIHARRGYYATATN